MKWICRCWRCSHSQGWTSEFDTFNTEREAIVHGKLFTKLIRYDETARDFEVYPQYEDEEVTERYEVYY